MLESMIIGKPMIIDSLINSPPMIERNSGGSGSAAGGTSSADFWRALGGEVPWTLEEKFPLSPTIPLVTL